MKDCNGNDIAIGDVVEVVEPSQWYHRGTFDVHYVLTKTVRVTNDNCGFSKPGSELRLVTRKDPR